MNECVKPPSEAFPWISLHGKTKRKEAFPTKEIGLHGEKESFLVVIILKKNLESGHFKLQDHFCEQGYSNQGMGCC